MKKSIAQLCFRHEKLISKSFSFLGVFFSITGCLIILLCIFFIGDTVYELMGKKADSSGKSEAIYYMAFFLEINLYFKIIVITGLLYWAFFRLRKRYIAMLNRSRTEETKHLVSILNQLAFLLSASAFTSDCQAGRTMSMDDLLNELSLAERKKVVIIDPNREFELLGKHFNFGGDRDAD